MGDGGNNGVCEVHVGRCILAVSKVNLSSRDLVLNDDINNCAAALSDGA